MELITFTTPQIYSIFAALSCAAVAGFIFYCIGLRTGKGAGYELGHNVAKNYWKKIVCNVRSTLGETRDLLDARTREMAALRQSIEQETADHATVERDLLNRLAAATQLVAGDHATLLNVAGKLQLAASTFAGIGAHDHAHTCSNLKSQVLDMAGRAAQANTQPHPDSELIDFLATVASMKIDGADWRIEYPSMRHPHRNASIRETIRCFREELERLENAHEEAEEAAQDREDAA